MARYRLTESKLREMIREAVQETINEIGDTLKGQERLGALQARYDKQGKGWGPAWVADDARYKAWQDAEEEEKKTGCRPNYNAIDRNMVNAFRRGRYGNDN